MDLALAIAKSGLEAQHTNIEVISNNLANAPTVGYKKSRAVFEDLPYDVTLQPGAPTTQETDTSSGLVMGTGTKMVGNVKMFVGGPQLNTGREWDMAISGRGFFQVQLPNGGGFAYTRNGQFTLNQQGQVTTQDGYILQPPITIPQGATGFTVGQDGTVSVQTGSPPTTQQLGQLQLADFTNYDGLQPIGQNLFQETTSSSTAILGTPQQNGIGSIVQNALEGSNVNIVEEMVNLIEAQRAFEITSKSVSAIDEMMKYLSQEA